MKCLTEYIRDDGNFATIAQLTRPMGRAWLGHVVRRMLPLRATTQDGRIATEKLGGRINGGRGTNTYACHVNNVIPCRNATGSVPTPRVPSTPTSRQAHGAPRPTTLCALCTHVRSVPPHNYCSTSSSTGRPAVGRGTKALGSATAGRSISPAKRCHGITRDE
jgi:hypothetical protein